MASLLYLFVLFTKIKKNLEKAGNAAAPPQWANANEEKGEMTTYNPTWSLS
jgi:hypothetical protein